MKGFCQNSENKSHVTNFPPLHLHCHQLYPQRSWCRQSAFCTLNVTLNLLMGFYSFSYLLSFLLPITSRTNIHSPLSFLAAQSPFPSWVSHSQYKEMREQDLKQFKFSAFLDSKHLEENTVPSPIFINHLQAPYLTVGLGHYFCLSIKNKNDKERDLPK